jgi:hypothetical protein
MQPANNVVGSDTKQARPRRSRPLPGKARKIAELAAEMAQDALRDDAQNLADHERVRALCNTAFTGLGCSFSRILKVSAVLTDDDKKFLEELKYI